MATSENINLGIRVSTMVQGLAGFDHLRASLGGVVKSAGLANTSLAKMALEFGGIMLAFKGVSSITGFFKESIEAAKEARAVQERLGIALERNPKIAAKGAQFIAEQQVRLTQLSESMDRSGVLAATSLQAGFAGLSRAGFSPDSIEKMSKGFEGVAIALKGVGASASDVADVAKAMQAFVKTGRPGELGQFFSKEQRAKVAKMTSEVQRATFVMEWAEKQGYRVGDAMETSAGKVAIAEKNWGRIKETLGTPFIDTQLAFTEMMGEMALALEPLSKEIATALTPAMQDMAKWFRSPEVKQGIKDFGEGLSKAFEWIKNNWDIISKGLIAIGTAAAGLTVFSILVNPVTLATAALAALAAGVILLIENWDKIGPAIQKLGSDIAGSTEFLWKPLTEGLKGIWPSIQTELVSMWEDIQMFFRGELDWGSLIENSIGPSIAKIDWGGIASAIGAGISGAFGAVGGAISSIDWGGVAEGIGHGIGNALKLIAWASFILPQDIYNSFVGVINGVNWSGVGANIVALLGTAANNALATAGFIAEMGGKVLVGLVTSLAGQDWGQVTAILVKGFTEALQGILREVASWGPKITQSIVGGLGNIGGAIAGAFKFGGGKAEAKQYGGLVSHPTFAALGEAGPEMVIPLNNKQRSTGLLAQTANMLGMGGAGKGGGGMTNVNVSMPITVNGASEGQGGAIAREIQRAMQDPIREMLDQLRAARDEERRMSYV
jgi:hypothetical protein